MKQSCWSGGDKILIRLSLTEHGRGEIGDSEERQLFEGILLVKGAEDLRVMWNQDRVFFC